MKLIVNRSRISDFKADHFLRQAGFAYIFDNKSGHSSYVRRLSRDFYPRLHLYVMEEKDKAGRDLIVLELHLDQKKASYQGVRMHSAEYDGDVVESEIGRLKGLLKNYVL